MKSKLILSFGLLLFAVLISSCKKSNNVTSPPETVNKNFYPSSDGNYYKYNVTGTDSAGKNVSGTRSSTYDGTAAFNGETYQKQIDTLTFYGISSTTTSYFIKNSDSVYFYLDTTGLMGFIPDTVKQLMQYINFSPQITAFKFPYQNGKSWTVFKMSFDYGVISYDLINVTGTYQGQENVTIDNNQTIQNAAKVHYVLTLKLPNSSNPLQPIVTTYSADAWLGPNIGLLKLKGNGLIIGALGGGISFADTASTMTQTLASYNVK